MISGVEDAARGKVEVQVTSDRLRAAPGRWSWVLTDLEGRTLGRGGKAILIPARANRRAATLDLAAPLARHGARRLLLWLRLTAGRQTLATNLILFARPKHLELNKPEIKIHVAAVNRRKFVVTLRARRPALWTWLELARAGARFSDNFFHLQPGRPLQITAAPSRGMTPAAFKRQLRVRSLVDSYRE